MNNFLKIKESDIQSAIRDALRLSGWYVIRHLHAMGTHPGLSDLSAVKNGTTIYIEVKRPNGIQSDVQKKFQKEIEDHGGTYILARSTDDILHLCDGIIKWEE